jgi:sensor domain CHASE-containing protein
MMTNMKKQNNSGSNILASIIPLSILFVLIQAASLIGFFHFSFGAVESFAIKKNLMSCIGSMQTELDRIGSVVYEWAAWDACASFMKGKNPTFLKENMVESSMQEQNLNAFCIVDPNGKPVWTRCVKYHDDKEELINLTLFSQEVLDKNPALWKHKDPNSCTAGYYSSESGVLMLFSRPITSSNNTGPVCGSVIMGRFISDKFIASIARQDCLDYEWWNLRSDYTRNALKQYLSQISKENPVYLETTPDIATAYTILPDIEGNNAILIKFVTANDVASFKKGWLAKCSAIYALEGLIFIVYLTAFANKHCSSCRNQITQDAQFDARTEYISVEKIAETQPSKDELLI